ncbi:MAG: signal peptidase I [Paenibacillus sp.]|nr:signal peptidase I [Paenibacillus sp.]
MYPFIQEGDLCFFRSYEPASVKIGDVLLFINDAGDLVCHRVIGVRTESDLTPALIICKGDTNLLPDPPIPSGQVIGKLTHIRKRKLTLSPDKGFGRLWGKLIIGMPPFAHILHRIAILHRWRSNYLSTRP